MLYNKQNKRVIINIHATSNGYYTHFEISKKIMHTIITSSNSLFAWKLGIFSVNKQRMEKKSN